MEDYSIQEKLDWTMILIYEFSQRHNLSLKQAFNYLSRYSGIDFVDRHYNYVHTQSFGSIVNDMTDYCRMKGGALQ